MVVNMMLGAGGLQGIKGVLFFQMCKRIFGFGPVI
jgi:hypothetical protein